MNEIKKDTKDTIKISALVAGVVAVLPLGSLIFAAGGKITDIESVILEQANQQQTNKEFAQEQKVIREDITEIRVEQAKQSEKLKGIDFNLQLIIRKLDAAQ